MAFANFSLTTAYTAIITALNAQLTAVAGMFKDQTTGDFVGQIRVSSTGKRLESWSGTAWVALDLSSTVITNATNSTNSTTAANATTHIDTVSGAVHGAVSTNTANMLVRRDASGNFSANVITASLTGNASGSSGSCTGLAATATKLATARAINGVNFDGTGAITITAAANDVSAWAKAAVKPAYTYTEVGAPSTTGTNASGSWGISITGSSASCTGNAVSATNATTHIADTAGAVHGAVSTNTANMLVRRDASGNFSANVITASLTGNVSGSAASCTGLAATATKLATARAINGVNFDGTGAITITAAANDVSAWAKAAVKPAYTYTEVGAPSTTGTNASGSWGISITGSSASCTGTAATATNALSLGGSLAALFAKLASPPLTGTPTAPTAAAGTNTTQLATTAYATAAVAAAKVNTALTGVPTAPTAAAGTNTTQISTTAFTMAAVANALLGPVPTWDQDTTGDAGSVGGYSPAVSGGNSIIPATDATGLHGVITSGNVLPSAASFVIPVEDLLSVYTAEYEMLLSVETNIATQVWMHFNNDVTVNYSYYMTAYNNANATGIHIGHTPAYTYVNNSIGFFKLSFNRGIDNRMFVTADCFSQGHPTHAFTTGIGKWRNPVAVTSITIAVPAGGIIRKAGYVLRRKI